MFFLLLTATVFMRNNVHKGKDVQLHLDEDDLFGTADDEDQTMKTAAYKACFEGTSKRVGVYINPQ